MKIALLVRGFHYLKRDRYGYALDGTDHFASFQKNVLEPLLRTHEVKVYLATYPSPVWPTIEELYAPTKCLLLDPETSQQVDTMQAGMEMIQQDFPDLDRIISTRFDIEYLQPISDWNIWGNERGVFVPWREYEFLWRQHKRVGDFFHVVDHHVLNAFLSALREMPSRADLHKIYASLEHQGVTVRFIESAFYDSNTYYSNAECFNPLYRIGNRPRIFLKQPITASTYIRLQILNYLERIISMHCAPCHNLRKALRKNDYHRIYQEISHYLKNVLWLVNDFIFDLLGKVKRACKRQVDQIQDL